MGDRAGNKRRRLHEEDKVGEETTFQNLNNNLEDNNRQRLLSIGGLNSVSGYPSRSAFLPGGFSQGSGGSATASGGGLPSCKFQISSFWP